MNESFWDKLFSASSQTCLKLPTLDKISPKIGEIGKTSYFLLEYWYNVSPFSNSRRHMYLYQNQTLSTPTGFANISSHNELKLALNLSTTI